MTLNPKIWLPKYMFIMQLISINYPKTPNDVTKKKYYDFIQNLPLLIPNKLPLLRTKNDHCKYDILTINGFINKNSLKLDSFKMNNSDLFDCVTSPFLIEYKLLFLYTEKSQ